MFERRDCPARVEAVRSDHAPDALVFDVERDFETLDSAVAEDLALVTDAIDPLSYPADWLPPDAPEPLARLASGDFTVGMPGDGGVAWTHQTDPPVVLVKPRLAGSPDDFVDFLLAEALVQVGLDVPEHFLGFFEARYRDIADAARDDLGPAGTYQLAAALYDAYIGLRTRDVFADWTEAHPSLFAAWQDAGERLEPRLDALSREVATGQTGFAEAAELACAAVKHAVEVPTPFDALAVEAYREYGADYAVEWTERTLEEV